MVRTSGQLSQAEVLTFQGSSLRPDCPFHGTAKPVCLVYPAPSHTAAWGGGGRVGSWDAAPGRPHCWSWKLRCLGLREGEALKGKQFNVPCPSCPAR